MHRKFLERMEDVRTETATALARVAREQVDVLEQLRTLFISGEKFVDIGPRLLAIPELRDCWPHFDLSKETVGSIARLLGSKLFTPAEKEQRQEATVERVATDARERMQKRLKAANSFVLTPDDRVRVLQIALECRVPPKNYIDHKELATRLSAAFDHPFTHMQARAALKNSLRLWRARKLSLDAEVAQQYAQPENN